MSSSIQKLLSQGEDVEEKQSAITMDFILFCIFLVLKLADKIDWSWWWIFSPLWIPAAIIIAIPIVIVLITTISKCVNWFLDRIDDLWKGE
jgi:hypothetical protein